MSPETKTKMTIRPSKLALVSIYAIVATIALSHHFVRDISLQLRQKNQIDENSFYEEHFLPTTTRPQHNNTRLSSRAVAASAAKGAEKGERTSRHSAEKGDRKNPATTRPEHNNASLSSRAVATTAARGAHPTPTFPIKTHIVTQGKPRTATTLLFNMVGVSYFLYLVENDPEKIPDVELSYWQRPKGYKTLRKTEKPNVVKAHVSLDNFLCNNTVVFTAAVDKKEAAEMKESLVRDGHTVAFVQDMETLKEVGVAGLLDEYVAGYRLSEKDKANLNEYFSNWEILRQCCGEQMSKKWRNDMMPEKFKVRKFTSHPTCATYDIDSIEQAFMKTELYSLIEKYPSVQSLNKASLNDGNLNGTYCSSYNHLIRTQGLSIWGQPGGRPVRSKIDGAIKDQIKKGRENLKPEGFSLFPDTDEPLSARQKAMWARPEKEKKEWLKAVLAARLEGGKSYSDYGIETSASADAGEEGGIRNDEIEGEGSGDVDSIASIDDQESNHDDVKSENVYSEEKGASNNDVVVEASTHLFDNTHAIFLISFGEEAAESTLVERCILSLRRRGAWGGYIVVLTDASPERYQNEWDDNVIVMHPLEEHLKLADGTPMKFTRENTSLKSKRFKTFIIDYMGMDKRLDSVELIYYLDIDIMAGNTMGGLFSEIEREYEVSQEQRSGGLSKLYFFTPLSEEWPLQGGTFIVERRSSRHCLELWRNEIDEMTKSGRGRDQDGLRTIHQRIESGEESKCQLIRMKNENFIVFPTPRTFDKVTRQSSNPNLIHISNSVFAKWIDEEAQNKYMYDLLQLSDEEKQSSKYGKVIVHAKKSDM